MRAICPRWGKLAHTQFWGRYMRGTSKVIYFERANRGLLPSQAEKGAGGPFQRFLFRGRAADHTTLSGTPPPWETRSSASRARPQPAARHSSVSGPDSAFLAIASDSPPAVGHDQQLH